MFSVALSGLFGLWLFLCRIGQSHLADLDRSTYITFMSGLATIVALFCSVSFGFVLFFMQSNRSERLSTYAELKSRLLAFHIWLLSLPESKDKEICMAMVFELEKLDISDLPQTDYGDEYKAYAEALDVGLEDPDRLQFYQTSILYSVYIEQLLSRIGVISIKQIITKLFLNTLSKGFAIVTGIIALLFTALVWFRSDTKVYFISLTFFFSLMVMLLFMEFAYWMYREVNEELDFVEKSTDGRYSVKDIR
ncbi:MAG: hypothetical protein WBW55_14100 [Desulfobaccales bacterium]